MFFRCAFVLALAILDAGAISAQTTNPTGSPTGSGSSTGSGPPAQPLPPIPSSCVTPLSATISLQTSSPYYSFIAPVAMYTHTETSTLYVISSNNPLGSPYPYGSNGGAIYKWNSVTSAWNLTATLSTVCAQYQIGNSAWDDTSGTMYVLCMSSSQQLLILNVVDVHTGDIQFIDVTSINCASSSGAVSSIQITAVDNKSIYLACTGSTSTCSTIFYVTVRPIITVTVVADSMSCPSPRSIATNSSGILIAACYDDGVIQAGTGRVGNGWITRINRNNIINGYPETSVLTNSKQCINPTAVSIGATGVVYGICEDGSSITFTIDPSSNPIDPYYVVRPLTSPSECRVIGVNGRSFIQYSPSLNITYIPCTPQGNSNPQRLAKRHASGALRQVPGLQYPFTIYKYYTIDQSGSGRVFVLMSDQQTIRIVYDTNRAPPNVP